MYYASNTHTFTKIRFKVPIVRTFKMLILWVTVKFTVKNVWEFGRKSGKANCYKNELKQAHIKYKSISLVLLPVRELKLKYF